jgi:hypothetical protein
MKSHMSRVEALALAELVRAAPGAISVRVHRRNPYDGSWRHTVSAVEIYGSGRRHWTSLEEYLRSPVLAQREEECADPPAPAEDRA